MMKEKEIRKLAEDYIDSCTKKSGFVILADGIKGDFIDLFVAGFMKCLEINKPNEWHYMKDVNSYEDLHFPPEEEEKGRVLIWKVQVITEKGFKLPVCYHCGSYGDLWYEINAYHVIAWREITLPEQEGQVYV